MNEHERQALESELETELDRQYRRIERGILGLRTDYEMEIARLKSENASLRAELDGLARWRVVRWLRAWRRLRGGIGRISPARLRQLRRTARMTVRRHGVGGLVRRGALWLMGKRGYWRELAGVTPPPKPAPRRANSTYPVYGFADGAYADHAARTEPDTAALDGQARIAAEWADRPLFSLVTAAEGASHGDLAALARSLRAQTYDRWEWRVFGAAITALAEGDPRIKHGGDPEGAFIGALRPDELLAPPALFRAAAALRAEPESAALYADQDRLDAAGRRCDPWFKPDWSPEMLLSVNLLEGFALIRRDHWRAGESTWEHALRLVEASAHVHHVPYVLAHRRGEPDSVPAAALAAHLARRGAVDAHIDPVGGAARASWRSSGAQTVSIIIPTKDNAPVLEQCLSTLFGRTDYAPLEVVVVDTGSRDPAAWALYERFPVRVVRYTEPFNFSRACNLGAAAASGDLLLFLNNDTEILGADWLARMAAWFALAGIGAVGARLLYPDGTLQHAGAIIGGGGVVGHVFIGAPEHTRSIYGSDDWTRNLMAVTGACLMVSRRAFDEVGGFDERYRLNYSDIALCVRLYECGYRIVYDPHVRLIHHEGLTHGRSCYRSDIERAGMEFGHWFDVGDPYYNPNLSYLEALPAFRRAGETGAGSFRAYLARLPQREHLRLPDDFLW